MAAIRIGNLQLKRNLIQGGMGVISTAQVRCDDPEFRQHPEEENLRVLPNIITVDAGIDAIISGAGLPTGLPRDTGDSGVKRSGGVSSERTAAILLKRWDAKFARTADFIVIDSPYSGGHQGYKKEQLADLARASRAFDGKVRKPVESLRFYEEKYGKPIPFFVGGGIMSASDVTHYLALGAANGQGRHALHRHRGMRRRRRLQAGLPPCDSR